MPTNDDEYTISAGHPKSSFKSLGRKVREMAIEHATPLGLIRGPARIATKAVKYLTGKDVKNPVEDLIGRVSSSPVRGKQNQHMM